MPSQALGGRIEWNTFWKNMMADSRAVCPSVDVSVGSTVTSLQTDDKMKQEARSFLRERFIRAVLAMNGKLFISRIVSHW